MKEGYYWCKHPMGHQHVALFSDGQWWVVGVAEPVNIHQDHVLWPVVAPFVPLETDRRIN